VRIASAAVSGLPNVTFRRPDGKLVLIVLNDGNTRQTFGFQHNGQTAQATLDAGAVGTFVW
jgi:glucosylceramidase